MSSLNFENLKALSERFVSQLLQKNYDKAASQFDDQMKTAFPESELKKSWQRVTLPAGDLIQMGVLQTAEMEGHRIVSYFNFTMAPVGMKVDVESGKDWANLKEVEFSS